MQEKEIQPEEVQVRCYSGRRYAERPLSFSWRGQDIAVQEVLAWWREPAGPAFRLRTEMGTFVLLYEESSDRWWLRPSKA
ncbi:MAG: hypothetical protein JXA37_00085 [Chloroflexia bacterium]|nr:hypothetical protein [Chloroflexia bacterium]